MAEAQPMAGLLLIYDLSIVHSQPRGSPGYWVSIILIFDRLHTKQRGTLYWLFQTESFSPQCLKVSAQRPFIHILVAMQSSAFIEVKREAGKVCLRQIRMGDPEQFHTLQMTYAPNNQNSKRFRSLGAPEDLYGLPVTRDRAQLFLEVLGEVVCVLSSNIVDLDEIPPRHEDGFLRAEGAKRPSGES